MSKVKDPLQAIQDALNAPIDTRFNDEAIARSMATRYSKPNLKDEVAITEVQETE